MRSFAKLVGPTMALVTLAVPLAFAGSKSSFTVKLDTTSRYAYGALGSVRNTTDTVQRIYCRSFASSSGSESLRCYATDAAGTTVSCYSTNATLIRSFQSLNGDAYVYFAWDEGGQCTTLDVLKGSHLAPKEL